jgi:hypothetical protein
MLWLPAQLVLVGIYAFLYALGGREQKLWRRVVAPAVLISGIALILLIRHTLDTRAFSLLLLFLPTFMGYGASSTLHIVIRRLIYGSFYGILLVFIAIIFGKPIVGMAQAILAIFASVYFGTLNPVPAVHEEAIIGCLSVLLIPFIAW